jgi:plastocyanin
LQHDRLHRRLQPEQKNPGRTGVYVYVRRIWFLLALALPLVALPCAAANGATTTVMALSSPPNTNNVFAPASVVITQGDTVTWTTDGLQPHNVRFEEFAFVQPNPPSTSAGWPVSETFTQPGTYHYYCEVHQFEGMKGTVVVNPAPPGGGGGGPPPPPPDTAPVSSLTSAPKQRVGRLFVRASMNEAGTLTATGTVSVPGGAAKLYRFKRARAAVSANQSVKLRLRLSKSALRVVRRALRRGNKLRAKIAVTATNLTGHETVRRQTVRLKR